MKLRTGEEAMSPSWDGKYGKPYCRSICSVHLETSVYCALFFSEHLAEWEGVAIITSDKI